LRRGWELHQKSTRARDMNWCMLWQFAHLGGLQKFDSSIPEFVGWLAQANYQKVRGSPLIYLRMDSDEAVVSQWGGDLANFAMALDRLAALCEESGLQRPYVVILHPDPTKAARIMKHLRVDAISDYISGLPGEAPSPFSKLLESNRRFWDRMAATGAPIVPIVMTGWDTRPRKINQLPWDTQTQEKRDAAKNTYVAPGTNDEIDNAIRNAATYVANNPERCPSGLVLIYSWNECDEGGGALVSKSYLATGHDLRRY